MPKYSETVVISLDEYIDLKVAAKELSLLEAEGVDNWSGCDYAYENYDEEEYRCELLKNLRKKK